MLRARFPRQRAAATAFLEVLDMEMEILPQSDEPMDPPAIDPDDLPHLVGAAAGDAEIFVTADRQLLPLELFGGTPIRSPRDAWPWLR